MKRFFRLVVVAFIGLGLAAAQQATVNHGVSLRGDSSTKNHALRSPLFAL
jgi:hypothetical protein